MQTWDAITTKTDIDYLDNMLPEVFTPAAPISEPNMLKGRDELLEDISRAHRRKGSCIILYGERGVGKTSIAKVATTRHRGKHFYYSACATDTFESIAAAILRHYDVHWVGDSRGLSEATEKKAGIDIKLAVGGLSHSREESRQDTSIMRPQVSPQEVCSRIPASHDLIIVDDFERISSHASRKLFADLIKKLSDNGNLQTLVIVGIAENIDELLASHESSGRSISECKVRRLHEEQIQAIIIEGMKKLDLTINADLVQNISTYSARFPYYTHLLCEGSVSSLITRLRQGRATDFVVSIEDVNQAINYAIRNTEHSISSAYETAVRSIKDTARFKYTLYAMASSPHEPVPYGEICAWVGGVSATDRTPVNVSHQLKVLETSGIIKRVSTGFYHFINPILKAFVILKARADSAKYELQAIDTQIKDTQKRLTRLGDRIP